MLFSSFTLNILLSRNVYATEVDSFTDRDLITQDALTILDQEMNRRLSLVIERANEANGCSKKSLAHHLKQQLRAGPRGFFMISPLEYFANENKSIKGIRHKHSQSIYKRVTIIDSFPIVIYPLGKLIKVNGHYISGDKFSHFLNVGWRYHQEIHKNKASLSETLLWGQKTERGIWGLAITGVYSNADLVANYDGLLFWETLLGGKDSEGITRPATIACLDKQCKHVRSFSWSEWVHAGWDEAINCNVYAPRVQRAIAKGRLDNTVQMCPLSIHRCREVSKTYTHPEYMFPQNCLPDAP